MTKPPVVVVEVRHCKISDRLVSRNGVRSPTVALRRAAAGDGHAKSPTLTGGLEPTILAGYFKRQSADRRGDGHGRDRAEKEGSQAVSRDPSRQEERDSAQRSADAERGYDAHADDLPDEMDLASSEYLHSFTFRLRGREKVFLQKIDHALEKIKEGTFGVCEQCGEPISLKRLEARLETTLCIRCKEDQERIEKAYG